MRLGGKGAPLAGLEIHDVVADPGDVAAAVVLADALQALLKSGERDAERGVGRLSASDRLEEQVKWRAALQGGELGADVGQAACLGRDRQRLDQAAENVENPGDGLDRLGILN